MSKSGLFVSGVATEPRWLSTRCVRHFQSLVGDRPSAKQSDTGGSDGVISGLSKTATCFGDRSQRAEDAPLKLSPEFPMTVQAAFGTSSGAWKVSLARPFYGDHSICKVDHVKPEQGT